MSHWNHRVVRRVYPDTKEIFFQIHEAYYGIEKKPLITTEPIAPYGETIDELRETLERMIRALDKPVLDYDTRKELESTAKYHCICPVGDNDSVDGHSHTCRDYNWAYLHPKEKKQ